MKPWVVISIYLNDLDLGKQFAQMAIEAGADWIEVDTPLILFRGMEAIEAIKRACPQTPVLADLKCLDGTAKYFHEAGKRGASVASILGIAADASIEAAVESGKKNKVKALADLYSIGKTDLPRRAGELQSLGVDFLLLHRGIDEIVSDPSIDALEGLKDIIDAVQIPVGAHTYTIDQGKQAVNTGASFVLQAMGTPEKNSNIEEEYRKVRNYILAVK
jgi:3-keto-L-gulonate-6-phosphate decarboxylase